ncbi:hypothetical protein BJ508DRAFT_118226 [Ascobolus immersus RN42]|uniref:Uncharacterized protein n=1 Tax=Ascobolus immersus RN42 TaxID=1160509 RepID=A0A3N4I4I9_ASCIM|nr:hypothetical protein BJ508DRAFT_118226 [Ascobolus immersus RN42]
MLVRCQPVFHFSVSPTPMKFLIPVFILLPNGVTSPPSLTPPSHTPSSLHRRTERGSFPLPTQLPLFPAPIQAPVPN